MRKFNRGQLITTTKEGISYWGFVSKIEVRNGEEFYHMDVRGTVYDPPKTDTFKHKNVKTT